MRTLGALAIRIFDKNHGFKPVIAWSDDKIGRSVDTLVHLPYALRFIGLELARF